MPYETKRVQSFRDVENGKLCYWKTSDGIWFLYVPQVGAGNLDLHDVTEHEDGTITVSPSILFQGHEKGERMQVHGFLERGVWRDC